MKQLSELAWFSRIERAGVAALVLLCGLSLAGPALLRRWQPRPAQDFTAFQSLVAGLQTNTQTADSLFSFDPNTATEADFRRLGLPERVAAVVVRYREKGGRFRSAEDLRKIYVLSEAHYERLAPWVRIGAARPVAVRHAVAPKGQPAESFAFDPNTATESDLQRLGLPERVVRNMLRYREKGGRFRKTEDFKKMHGLPEADYERLAPYMTVAVDTLAPVKARRYREIPVVDINRSTGEDWQQLPGIGATRATRILAFRDKLGGFASVEQVAETWGLPDSVFQKIRPYLQSSEVLVRIPVNTATQEQLAAHPYCSFPQARMITAYRAQHGPYQRLEDLLKAGPQVDAGWLEKMRLYLVLE